MAQKVLVVDDVEINRDILEEILEDTYTVIKAENGVEALACVEENADDLALILLDLVMPEMDGFGVLAELQHRGHLNRIPVIVITGSDSLESAQRCYDFGVADFIRKPFDEAIVRRRAGNIADLYSYKNNLEDKVSEQTRTLQQQNEQLQRQAEELQETNNNIINIMSIIVKARSLESGEHIERVKAYTEIMARQMMQDYPEYHMTDDSVDVMVAASTLHDIGKVAIPDSILLKPGRLTDEEFGIMKTHTTQGALILDNIGSQWNEDYTRMSYDICRFHHERYDGRGYPDGLVGDEIPISAQIVSIADVYDALINERVYKGAFSKETAFNMMMNGECGTFSPKLLDTLKKVRPQFEDVSANRLLERM